MKAPFSWLKEYVDIDISAQELEEKLFGCGFEVEELIDLGGEIDGVVVGQVVACEKVEGTHLFTCQVNCGEYGVIDLADKQAALRWLKDIHAAMDRYGIGRALWNYKEKDFGFTGEHFADIRDDFIRIL